MIPRLMCTQHPDATVKVTTLEEVDEALVNYTAYGCEEVMVDYEGKTTPYSQPKEIVMKALEAGIKLGTKYFITPRMPNPKLEELDKAMLTMEAAVMANYFSMRYMDTQAVRWIVLPMVEDFETLALVEKMLYRKVDAYREEMNIKMDPVDIIPLLEDAFVQLKVEAFLAEFLRNIPKKPDRIRLFLGKSDSAVRHGHLASALAIVYVLSKLSELEQKLDVRILPILGMGSPPFRGGINNPALAHLEVIQYAGYHTVTIQSAVRYDVSYEEYQRVRDTLLNACCIKPKDVGDITHMVSEASMKYKAVIQKYTERILDVAKLIPSTRDRITWKQYGRSVISQERVVNMPRAIVYTSTWYAMGLPPIFLDAPYILELAREDKLDEVMKILPTLEREWEYDANFFDPYTARRYLGEEFVKQVEEALDYFGISNRARGTYAALLRMQRNEPNVISLGKYRKFLG